MLTLGAGAAHARTAHRATGDIGILLTALSQLSLINEGWQILLGSLILYPVYAWALIRLAPAPENMALGLQRWLSRRPGCG